MRTERNALNRPQRVPLRHLGRTEGSSIASKLVCNQSKLLARKLSSLSQQDGLVDAGSAFVTLPQPARDQFWTRTEALKIKRPAVKAIARNRASFVKPELRVRAKHLKGGDMSRHASLTALIT
jgi:hypothetical protein